MASSIWMNRLVYACSSTVALLHCSEMHCVVCMCRRVACGSVTRGLREIKSGCGVCVCVRVRACSCMSVDVCARHQGMCSRMPCRMSGSTSDRRRKCWLSFSSMIVPFSVIISPTPWRTLTMMKSSFGGCRSWTNPTISGCVCVCACMHAVRVCKQVEGVRKQKRTMQKEDRKKRRKPCLHIAKPSIPLLTYGRKIDANILHICSKAPIVLAEKQTLQEKYHLHIDDGDGEFYDIVKGWIESQGAGDEDEREGKKAAHVLRTVKLYAHPKNLRMHAGACARRPALRAWDWAERRGMLYCTGSFN